MDYLRSTDPEIFEAIRSEAARQASQLELIASENFVSRAVLEAMGTVLTNKYAEGLPRKRYYGGCEFVDEAEELARSRAISSSRRTIPTFNRTPAPRPTWPPTSRCWSPVTRSWGWT